MTRQQLFNMTDAQIDKSIMYQVTVGTKISILDSLLRERARRGGK